jgi:ribosomal protein S20
VPAAYSEIDRAEKRGAIHRNAAARYKSRLAKAAAKKS